MRQFSLVAAAAFGVLLITSTVTAAEADLTITSTDNSATITRNGKPVLQYCGAATPFKPYVKELFTPGGVQILRDSPSDHKHHHALMFATAVDNVNFWEEAAGAGTQKPLPDVHQYMTSWPGSMHSVGFEQKLDWIEPRDGKTLLVEKRTIDVDNIPGVKPVTFVNWGSRLSAAGTEAVKLTAEGHHYFGLGMRFLVSMDTGGRFFNAAGKPGEVVRGTEQLVSAKWCAYTAKADGKPVTVAIFDHPQNPRYPNKLFTMTVPFAYLSATLNLWKEPLTLQAGHPLALRWGVALWDGEVPAEQVEKTYEAWVKGRK